MSIQSGTSPGAIISSGNTPAGAPVTSVFGRVGNVVAVPGDYGSDDITNESGVAGATVSDALDQLDADAVQLSVTSPADVTKSPAVVGVGTTAARSDHKHDITTAAAVSVSTTNTEGVATTLARSDHTHAGVASFIGRLGAVVAVLGDYTSSLITNLSTVAGATVTDALNALNTSVTSPYHWTWANATARMAQAVTAAEVGFVGFQTDMQREYKLLGTSPTRWGEMTDSSLGPARSIVWVGGTSTIHNLGFIQVVISGAPNTRGATGTTRSTQLLRGRLDTSTTAGIVAATRMAGNTFCPTPITGFRLNQRAVLGAVSTNMRWFMGITDSAASTNVDPGTFINSLGIGRGNGEANAQLYCNDAAGVATQVDLGASFPAATLNTGYECQIYTLTGASYTIQVRNLDTGAEFSQAFVANIPVATTGHPFMFYVTNNTDAVNISLDTAEMVWAQITR